MALEPLAGWLPLQPPDAVQTLAPTDVQLKVAVPWLATVLGVADKVTAGAPAVAVTVTDCDAVPPGPVQVSVYWVDAASAPVLCEPLGFSLPLHPPDAAQVRAF